MPRAIGAFRDNPELPYMMRAIGGAGGGYRTAGHDWWSGTAATGLAGQGAQQRPLEVEQRDKVVGGRAVRLHAGGEQERQADLTSSYGKLGLMNNKKYS